MKLIQKIKNYFDLNKSVGTLKGGGRIPRPRDWPPPPPKLKLQKEVFEVRFPTNTKESNPFADTITAYHDVDYLENYIDDQYFENGDGI